MDHREAVFGECVDDRGAFDLAIFAERLLLFERVVLRSPRLEAVPALVSAFGIEHLIQLLNSGAIELDCNAYGIGVQQKGPLVPFNYTMVWARSVEAHNRTIPKSIEAAVGAVQGARQVQRDKLANALERRCVRLGEDFLASAAREVARDLTSNRAGVQEGVVLAAGELVGTRIRPADVQVEVRHEGESRFFVENNLLQIGLDEVSAHRVIQGALLAVAATEQRLEQMRLHTSTSVFREEEVRVLGAKISLAWEQFLAGGQHDRLTRVLSVAGFPDVRAAIDAGSFDFVALLEARESPECISFRRWLRSTDGMPDAELADQIASMKNKLAVAVRSPVGKTLRWVANVGVGLIPVVGSVAGAATGLVDSFLLEQVLPQSGAIAFLNGSVRSILYG